MEQVFLYPPYIDFNSSKNLSHHLIVEHLIIGGGDNGTLLGRYNSQEGDLGISHGHRLNLIILDVQVLQCLPDTLIFYRQLQIDKS